MPKYCCWSCSWSIKRLPMSNLARQQHSQQEHITWSHGCWILFVQPSSNDDSLASFACLNEFCISKTLQALWTNSGTICWLPRCKVSWNFSCLIQLQVVTTKAQKHEASNLKNTCRLKASEAIHTNKSNYICFTMLSKVFLQWRRRCCAGYFCLFVGMMRWKCSR